MNGALAAELGAALSPERVRTGATELGLYRRDASNIEGTPGIVCFPVTTGEVQACVSAAVRHGVAFVARGAGTGLAGGAVPLDHALVIVTTNDRWGWGSPGEDYVTLAIGRDYADVSPIRGVIHGGAHHTLTVGVTVRPVESGAQTQTQSQGQNSGQSQSQSQSQNTII